MASWIEIERVRKDPKAFKPLAKHLLADTDYAQARSDSATDFLENVSRYRSDELTTRQGEFLLELRDEARAYFKIGDGLSVEILIEKFYHARADLSRDRDIQFIEALRASGRKFIRGIEIGRFLSIQEGFEELGGI